MALQRLVPTYVKPTLVRRDPVSLVLAVKSVSQKIFKPAPCWVARAVYGADNPRWLLFRDWLAFQAPGGLRQVYLRHGEAVARLVGHSALLRHLLRPLMDRAIRARFGGRVI
jgi:hypothetical protein